MQTVKKEVEDARAMAAQNAKLAALGRLSACMAHEICNPLNFLINILPDLRRDMQTLKVVRTLAMPAVRDPAILDLITRVEAASDLPSHLEEMDYVFDRINKALESTLRIASGLKTFSRPPDPRSLASESVAGMVERALALIPAGHRRRVQIAADLPGDLRWHCNRNEIEQVILSLVNNALEAMEGQGRLEIVAIRHAGVDQVYFRDTGPGIPGEHLSRLFEPFFTTKPEGKGTGLGLYIASELVRKHAGELKAESETGRGATFRILLPARPAAPVAAGGG